MSRVGPARECATRVLFRVASEGAFAAAALDAEISSAKLDTRDAAQATEIVYGSLRVIPALDARIDALRPKKSALDAWAHAALRASVYQLDHLRVPSHAAVNDAVTMVRGKRGEGLARFVNAILRKVAKTRPEEPAPPQRVEVPAWVRKELMRSLGVERAERFLDARALPPPLSLRVTPGQDAQARRAALLERLNAHVADAGEPVTLDALSPLGLLARGVGDPRALPGYAEGAFAVQDTGSQLIALMLDAQPGERVADVCAGRGGKTALLAAMVGKTGSVTAIDLHERKLEQIPSELARLRIDSPLELETIDLSVGTGGLDALFDRVLCDAPCTGLGTLHRRPELLLRVTPQDPKRMAELQLSIAQNAASMVKPGGLLVLSVCSPTRAEGADVVARLLALRPDLSLEPGSAIDASVRADEDGIHRLGPWNEARGAGPDAYQAARLRRSKST